jgi:hypothetical protein
MPPKSPSLYNLNKTTITFAAASVILLIGLVAMVFQDSSREWKSWQRKFMNYSRQESEKQLAEAKKKVDQKKIDELKQQRQKAEADIKGHRKEIDRIKKEIEKADLDFVKAKAKFQDLKQELDSARYFYEEARAHHEKQAEEKYKQRLDKETPQLQQAKVAQEVIEAKKDALSAELAKFTEAEKSADRDIAKMLVEQTTLEKKIKKLKPSITNAILNAPMLDFIKPTLRIQQIVVENLYDDFYFNKAQKVDRCITCHLGIDQKAFEGAPVPFKSHPRLDLFLASKPRQPIPRPRKSRPRNGQKNTIGRKWSIGLKKCFPKIIWRPRAQNATREFPRFLKRRN